MKNILHLTDEEFKLFQDLFLEEGGLYFDKDRSDSLLIVLNERMQKCGFDSSRQYYNFLKFHEDGRMEIRILFDLVTVGETYFFRNKPHFDALTKFVFPQLISKKKNFDKSLRIWSAGSSKGAEAYSVAMVLMELLPDYKEWDISIIATDINREALLSAQEGIYGRRDVSHMPEGYLEKYFVQHGKDYLLSHQVKSMVQFMYHNLAKDAIIQDKMTNLDIVFCRNVLIYFDTENIKRVIKSFYNCLKQGGYLFLGHAETLWHIHSGFSTVEFPQTFFYKKATAPLKEEEVRPFVGIPELNLEEFHPIEPMIQAKELPLPEKTVQPEIDNFDLKEEVLEQNDKSEIEDLYKEAIEFFRNKRYREAMMLFDEIIEKDKHCIRAYFARATILSNQAYYDQAIQELNKIIEVDNLYVEAYYLLGVLFYKTGNFEEAEAQFRKVVYVDPNITLAYFNLGNIYLCRKRFTSAEREFNNAIKLLQNRPKDQVVRFCDEITTDFLLMACKNNLEKIARG